MASLTEDYLQFLESDDEQMPNVRASDKYDPSIVTEGIKKTFNNGMFSPIKQRQLDDSSPNSKNATDAPSPDDEQSFTLKLEKTEQEQAPKDTFSLG